MTDLQRQHTIAGEVVNDASVIERRIGVLAANEHPMILAEKATAQVASGSVAVANS